MERKRFFVTGKTLQKKIYFPVFSRNENQATLSEHFER